MFKAARSLRPFGATHLSTSSSSLRRTFASPAPKDIPSSAEIDRLSGILRSTKIIAAGATLIAFSIGMYVGREAAGQQSSTSSKSPYALKLKGQHEAYPPKFGSRGDFLKGIEELRQVFGALGRDDDVSVDEADLESHGISAITFSFVPRSSWLPAEHGLLSDQATGATMTRTSRPLWFGP